MERKFSLSKEHAPKAGLTISTRETESGSVGVTYFSLGKDTDISAERYPEDVLYLGNFGSGEFRLRKAVEDKEQLRRLAAGEAVMVKKNMLCGVRTTEGFYLHGSNSGKGYQYERTGQGRRGISACEFTSL